MNEIIYTSENPGEFAEKAEKHIPVFKVVGENKVIVKVGMEEHPMEPTHYIEWIALMQDGEEIARKNLTPADKPVAEFQVKDASNLKAREHCNIHGTWESN